MTTPRVIAVIPVRMGSSRLPGKTLLPIASKPMLAHLCDRLRLASQVNDIVVATSVNSENDEIEAFCTRTGVHCFRGPEDDVLARLLGALDSQNADIGVLAFGDAPLLDPRIVDEFVQMFLEDSEVDFIGNDLTTTYPPGMEVEVFRVEALRGSDALADAPEIREHGTLFIRQNPDLYRIKNIEASGAHRRPELEIEVDTQEDFLVVSAIVESFGDRTNYSLDEIIAFLDQHEDLRSSNQDVPRRWKQFRNDSN